MENTPEDCNDQDPAPISELPAGMVARELSSRGGDQVAELESPAGPPGIAPMAPPMNSFEEPSPPIGPVTPPLPNPDLNHPQQFPNASTPPEPALGGRDAFGSRDAAAGWGGVAGGVNPQEVPSAGDALPTGMGLNDICRSGETFWGPQWGE